MTRRSEVVRNSMSTVIPCVMLARYDTSASVRRVWGLVWEEATSGVLSSVLRLYSLDIFTLCVKVLEGASWRLKQCAARVIVEVRLKKKSRVRHVLRGYEC